MFRQKSCLANLLAIISLFSFFGVGVANLVTFDKVDRQACSGLYSKSDWGGHIKPHIDLLLKSFEKERFSSKKHNNKENKNIDVSWVIFEYQDLGHIGYYMGDGKYKLICDDYAIKHLKVCTESEKGSFIVDKKYPNSTVMTSHFSHLGNAKIDYPVNRTGYYCVFTVSLHNKDYSGVISFQNAFGYLSASEIPKLPAYGILTLCYAIFLALFGFQFFKKRHENQILPLQKYLLAMLGFLTFDTLVVWSYYDLVNRTKNPSDAFLTFYMVFLSVLNAIKTTFAFFILLCIALGYGVVKLKLSKKIMLRCKILAGVHFIASCYYLIATYYTGSTNSISTSHDPNETNVGILGLIPLIPVSITLTTYYVAILVSIRQTTASLHQQRQIIKLLLYQNLFRIIFFSVFLTLGGLVLSSFIFLSMTTTQMFEQHWKGAFFIFDFWPSVVFFGIFLGVAWLWRPTETSYMLAVSQQVASNDMGEDDANGDGRYQQGNEFELDDLSLLSHSDQENDHRDDHDSFELARDENPPKYSRTEEPQMNHSAEPSSTLFELGEESDEEHKDDDRLDNKDKEKDTK